jgi:hypothetical protein
LYIIDPNKRKFGAAIFLKFVISVVGDQFLALGARKPSYASDCVPFTYNFLRTQIIKTYIHSGTDNLQNTVCMVWPGATSAGTVESLH